MIGRGGLTLQGPTQKQLHGTGWGVSFPKWCVVSKFKRPCIVCGRLSHGSRCDVHQAEANAYLQRRKDTPERLAKKRLMYNTEYRRRRAEVLATATACHLCKKTFVSGDSIEADHLAPGDPRSALAAAHRRCNQSRGDKPLSTDT